MIEEADVPGRWEITTIGEISTEIRTGGTPKKSEDRYWGGDIPWKASKHFNEKSLELNPTTQYVTQEGKSESTMANKGDVLLVCRGAHTGKVGIAGQDILFNQDVKVIRLPDNVISKYVAYFLLSNFEYFNYIQRGGTTKGITTSNIESLEIPLPRSDEQERIVDSLEERLERVGRLEKSVESVGRLAEEYEDSLLSYVFTGRGLNQKKRSDGEEWFKQIPKDWEVRELKEIGSRVSSMTEPKSGDTYSLYSFDSVDDGSGYYEVSGEEIGSRKRELSGGEVMISRLNPRISRVQKVDMQHEHPPIASSEFVAIDVENYVSREYLYEYLRNPILKERLTNHVTGSTGSRARVGFDFVMESRIPVPPKNEQEEIVEKIRSVDFGILEKSYSDVSILFDEYRGSVLSHAFRGEVDC